MSETGPELMDWLYKEKNIPGIFWEQSLLFWTLQISLRDTSEVCYYYLWHRSSRFNPVNLNVSCWDLFGQKKKMKCNKNLTLWKKYFTTCFMIIRFLFYWMFVWSGVQTQSNLARPPSHKNTRVNLNRWSFRF